MTITVGNLKTQARNFCARTIFCWLGAMLMALTSSYVLPLSIKLKLTTVEGAALQQAAAGKPFLLNVVVTDASDSAQYPVLQGIEHFHVRQSGFQLNMVNGSTSVTYHYRIRIDTPGTYTLGPAQLTHQNEIVESEPISVIVGQEEKNLAAVRGAQSKTAAPLLKLTCPVQSAFVGEKIPVQLAFYTSDPTTSLQSIGEPELNAQNGFMVKNKQPHPTTGTEKINGTEYRFAKWNFDICATVSGTITVPAYSADYTSSGGKPMLSFFFKNESKRAYSNTLTLDIKPLAPSYKTPALVGTVSTIEAHIQPAHARVGEGMVLAIRIAGRADFDRLGMLDLELPESLKWYESKKYTDANQGYTMEYIVQATHPGTFEIPKQGLYYFDTQEKTYKTVYTNPLKLHISGIAIPAAHQTALDTQAVSEPDTLAPIEQAGPIQASTPGMIPWPLFWIIIATCSILWILCLLIAFKKNLLKQFFNLITPKKSIYAQARSQIQSAYQAKAYTSFYAIMHTLFAHRLNLNTTVVTPDIIINSLLQDGLSKQAVDDWMLFYDELSQVSFYRPELDREYYRQLVQKIGYWIDVLEKLPRVRL